MGFLDKLFGKKQASGEEIENLAPQKDDRPIDTLFVENFKEKGGKFLYCENKSEILDYLQKIFSENVWESAYCFDDELIKFLNVASIVLDENARVFVTGCEHLLAQEGSMLFSSNQLKERKLDKYPNNFVVLARIEQLKENKDQALTSIKQRFKNNLPTNISAIADYLPEKKEEDFLNYGNNNSKNLYLLLLED